MEREISHFDVAVIGGGPAGLIAAGRSAELGAKVILIEKNKRLGRKLLLTGKGRCNLTNAEFDLRKFIEHYGKNGSFLFHALSFFGVKETMGFFEKQGVKLKTERGKRVFPESDKAEDILEALIKRVQENGVVVMNNAEVLRLEKEKNRISKIVLKREEIFANNYIIATGGKSYPATGSTGDGFKWAKDLGHNIILPKPALTPLKIKEKWFFELKGLVLKNIELNVFQDKKKQFSKFGECLFTHFGIGGPAVLDISKRIGKILDKGTVKIFLDLKPALDFKTLDQRVQRDFIKNQNKLFKNSLNALLPIQLVSHIIRLSDINPEKPVNHITKEERHKLTRLLKRVDLTVADLLGFESAIVTSGGVDLKEIDHKTMKSKIIDNLFFAGEVIDIDGPTGGFNLQACWSTGYLAGQSATKDSIGKEFSSGKRKQRVSSTA